MLFIPNIIVVVSLKMKIIKIIFYKNKFIDFLCFKGFIPSLAEREGMIIPLSYGAAVSRWLTPAPYDRGMGFL